MALYQSGTREVPFREAPWVPGWIYAEWGSTVVIVELPENLAYVLSNDPASVDFPETQVVVETGVVIEKLDYKDHWMFEPISSTIRYYTSTSYLYAPIGYEGGYGELEVLASGFPDPVGDGAYAPYSDNSFTAIAEEGADSAAIVSAYFDSLSAYEQGLYAFVNGTAEIGDRRVYHRGVQMGAGTLAVLNLNGIGLATSGIDPDRTWNALCQINVHDDSLTYCALVQMKRAKEVELFQTDINFQGTHTPAPTVTLTAYNWPRYEVEAATKRLIPYVPVASEGEPDPPSPTLKWTKTITLSAYPPARIGDVSLGRFNKWGFAAPGEDLPTGPPTPP